MTPAIDCAKQAGIEFCIHQYEHDSSVRSYGEEAAEKLNIASSRVFKTLVISLDGKTMAVAVVPVPRQLNLKSMAASLKVKKSTLAAQADVERTTGYVLGGVSPLGQKKVLGTVIDESALQFDTIFVSAGRRGLEIELTPRDLGCLTNAIFAPIATVASTTEPV